MVKSVETGQKDRVSQQSPDGAFLFSLEYHFLRLSAGMEMRMSLGGVGRHRREECGDGDYAVQLWRPSLDLSESANVVLLAEGRRDESDALSDGLIGRGTFLDGGFGGCLGRGSWSGNH